MRDYLPKQKWKDITLLISTMISVALLAIYWPLWKERFPGCNVELLL